VFLAEALYRQGRDDEALALTEESQAVAADDDVATQYLWRCVRAKVLARRGDLATGEALAREAIAIIENAQDPESQGYAWLDLAEVLAMAGRTAEATAAATSAEVHFATKGNEPSAARAARFRRGLGG
jgi:tetratricopeptide (TPR) repeat protein